MLSYKATLACVFTLASSVSAAILPTDSISNVVSSVAVQASVPTNIASGITSSVSAQARESAPTSVVSVIMSSVSSQSSVTSSVASAVSSMVSGKPFPTDVVPAFKQLTELSCKYGNVVVSPATNGIEIPVAQLASAPLLSTSSALDGEHILIMIDPDVSTPEILHFMQPGLISASNSSAHESVPLITSEAPAVKYLQPTPSAGSGPHRYTFFLFVQPNDFQLSDSFDASNRVGFDIVKFAAEYGLGVPIAGTFFVAQTKSGSLTNSTTAGNGTLGNTTHVGSSHNGTVLGGNSMNGTVLHGNGTSNSTHGGYHNVNGTLTGNGTLTSNGTVSGDGTLTGNGTVSGDGINSTFTDSSSSASVSSGSSSTGNVPVSPSAAAVHASNDSASKSSAYVANFALAGFVALVSIGVVSL